ncbi:hypothetical protein, partial [Bacteroides oleiciplenus]|uniref:hypothetical protein n=1 Tax=Bacteroides oleiciplenus TaxID=626931 RepID=UPI0026DD6B9E
PFYTICQRTLDSYFLHNLWGGGVPGGRGGRYGYTDEITLSKECEALKKRTPHSRDEKRIEKETGIYIG